MGKGTDYVSHQPDERGHVEYSDAEHETWSILMDRQMSLIQGKACDEYMQGLDQLAFSHDYIPQLPDVSAKLRKATGWEVAHVPSLIPFSQFFDLLANKRFPAATFIRKREELDYLQEPDIFHELFGHTPLLTNPYFAEFTHTYGKLGLAASKEDRIFLARMYWFTVEFGLIQTPDGLRIYGGGILSSIGETDYCLSDKPQRKPFDIVDVLRTPYRIDIMQPIYYVINDMKRLFDLAHTDIMARVEEAKALGLFPPAYPPKDTAAA